MSQWREGAGCKEQVPPSAGDMGASCWRPRTDAGSGIPSAPHHKLTLFSPSLSLPQIKDTSRHTSWQSCSPGHHSCLTHNVTPDMFPQLPSTGRCCGAWVGSCSPSSDYGQLHGKDDMVCVMISLPVLSITLRVSYVLNRCALTTQGPFLRYVCVCVGGGSEDSDVPITNSPPRPSFLVLEFTHSWLFLLHKVLFSPAASQRSEQIARLCCV